MRSSYLSRIIFSLFLGVMAIIIRKTKRSDFLERSDIFNKTKCTSGVYPRFQNKIRPASTVFTT